MLEGGDPPFFTESVRLYSVAIFSVSSAGVTISGMFIPQTKSTPPTARLAPRMNAPVICALLARSRQAL